MLPLLDINLTYRLRFDGQSTRGKQGILSGPACTSPIPKDRILNWHRVDRRNHSVLSRDRRDVQM